MISESIKRGDWLKLPSGAVVSVCKIEMRDGVENVSLRYLDSDGVMATGDFLMTLKHLRAHAEKVEVAPCPI
jgi:hypothetical protein